MQTPAEAVADAQRYLLVCTIGFPFITGYNAVSGIYRGLGDSKTPVYLISIACAVNIALVGYFGLGAAGAAWATTAAQGGSFLCGVAHIVRRGFSFSFGRQNFRPKSSDMIWILKAGLPIAMQDVLVHLSFLAITAIINTLGLVASAAVGVAEKFMGFAFIPSSAFSSAVAAMVAQNVGAGKCRRAVDSMKYGIGFSLICGVLICLVCQHEYGGSQENRCRLAIEVLQAVRKAVGPGFLIEFRMSGSELFPEGHDCEEGVRIARLLEPHIDLLHVSAGTYQRGFGDTHPSMFREYGCNVHLAAEIKKHVSVSVAAIGRLNDLAQMEEIIASGQAIPFKKEMYQLAATYRRMVESVRGEIRTGTEVTAAYAEEEQAEALIIAVGSAPIVPPIPGLDGENVVVVNDYYRKKEAVTDSVVVLGGGLAGCECAIRLGMEGKTVHLVEMRDALAPDANVRHRPLLLREIEK